MSFYFREKNGRIKKGGYKGGRGYSGYHITFDKKRVFLRSLLEYNFALYLDKTFQFYDVESMKYIINGKTYKPDFFIYNSDYTKLIKIIDIKGTEDEANNLLNSCKEHFNKLEIEYEVFYRFDKYKSYITADERNKWINNYVTAYPDFDFRGKKNPMFGIRHSKSTKKKIGDKTREYMKIPEIREKHRNSIKNFWKSESAKEYLKEYKEVRKKRSIEFHKNKDILDPILEKTCIICLKSFNDRKSKKKITCSNSCSQKYGYITNTRKSGFKDSGISRYKNRILIYSKEIKPCSEDNWNKIIKDLKKIGKIPKNFGMSMSTIEKYFGTFENFKKEIKWEN